MQVISVLLSVTAVALPAVRFRKPESLTLLKERGIFFANLSYLTLKTLLVARGRAGYCAGVASS